MKHIYAATVRNKYNPSDYFFADFLTVEEVKEIVKDYNKAYKIIIRDLDTLKDVTKKFIRALDK